VSWRNLIWMSVVVCLAVLSVHLARRQPPRVQPHDPAVDRLAGAIHAYKTIQRHSYPELPPERATRGAIQGMVQQVDAYSGYIPPEKGPAVNRRVEGELNETGLRIIRRDARLITVGALPDSPAQKAGIHGGLEILAINGTEAAYLTLSQGRAMLEGPGKVVLRLRTFEGQAVERTLESARFEIPSVTGLVRYDAKGFLDVLDEKQGIGYIRIGEFVKRTGEELQAAYRRLDRPRGLVLDLRDNPGGMLPAALEVADSFLSEGLIVAVVQRGGDRKQYYARSEGTLPPVPLAVLIDGQTASAAEIVAGALQVHGRATLVGEPSFGKWQVESFVPLDYGLGEVYLTTGEYFLAPRAPGTRPATLSAAALPAATQPASTLPAPAGRGPLHPDVPVRLTVAAREQLEELRLQAMVLPAGPLATTLPDRLGRAEKLKRSLLASDAQLGAAVALLRARLSRPVTTRAAATATAPLSASGSLSP
jgi:carboxyl-terminal processing protease